MATNYWESLEDIRANWALSRVFQPGMKQPEREKLLKGWKKAVKCALVWAEEE
jgi:glycerol kinase